LGNVDRLVELEILFSTVSAGLGRLSIERVLLQFGESGVAGAGRVFACSMVPGR
jgi:hypothetical protein